MENDVISASSRSLTGDQNRVLRNTYALLALSMLPTVLGASIGTTVGVGLMLGSPILSLILFIGLTFGLMFAIEKNKNSALGVVLLLGFTFVMGLMLGPILRYALGFANGGSLIAVAAGGTGLTFLTLAGIASNSQRDFSKLGGFLFAGVVAVLVLGLANVFLHMPILTLIGAAMAVLVFSALILFDINRIVRGGETNYVTATLSVYLDIYNVFVNLLQILLALAGDRR